LVRRYLELHLGSADLYRSLIVS